MNIIGKILVILNLVFALVVGGFLVIDFATRSNWKNAYESLKREMEVAKTNTNISGKTLQDLVTQIKRAEAEKEELKQKLVEHQLVADAKLKNQQLAIDDANQRIKDADLNAERASAEKERLQVEVKGLAATVQNRDATILDLQNDNRKYRTEAISQKNTADAMQKRNESLLEQNQDTLRKLQLRDVIGSDSVLVRDPNAPNPPPTDMHGKVDKIDTRDRTLVQISLGSDQGLKLHHTLEVFRMNPQPQYLGMIRIEDVREHSAVGKLIRNSISGTHALQVGDIVATSTRIPAR